MGSTHISILEFIMCMIDNDFEWEGSKHLIDLQNLSIRGKTDLLKQALQEGVESGISTDFHPDDFLKALQAKEVKGKKRNPIKPPPPQKSSLY